MSALLSLAVLLALAPLLPVVAGRMVAALTGRKGAPLLQPYRDLRRLWGKGAFHATATTWIFTAVPLVWVGSAVAAACLVPLDGSSGLARFAGDPIVLAGLLAVGRFSLTLGALDTGSSFEGMGASRELMIGCFAEPVLFLTLSTLALVSGGLATSELFGTGVAVAWAHVGAAVAMVGLSLFMLMLAEAARGPIDDPTTHLELTMVHEVMILDYAGPELALLLYGSAVRFALIAALVVRLLWPVGAGAGPLAILSLALGITLVAVLVGLVEASIARLRLVRIPQYLVSAGVLAALGALLVIR